MDRGISQLTMKKLLVFLLLVLTFPAGAGIITNFYTFTDFNLTAQAVRRVTQTPIQPFADYNGAILAPNPVSLVSGGSGTVYFTNTIAGYAYRVQLDTPFGSTVRTCGYPSYLTGTVNGRDWLGNFGPGSVGGIPGMTFYFLYPSPTNVTPYSLITTNGAPGPAAGLSPIVDATGSNWFFGSAGLTPWTTDINGAQHSLTNAGSVVSSNLVGLGSLITNAAGNAFSDKTATNTLQLNLSSGLVPLWNLWASWNNLTNVPLANLQLATNYMAGVTNAGGQSVTNAIQGIFAGSGMTGSTNNHVVTLTATVSSGGVLTINGFGTNETWYGLSQFGTNESSGVTYYYADGTWRYTNSTLVQGAVFTNAALTIYGGPATSVLSNLQVNGWASISGGFTNGGPAVFTNNISVLFGGQFNGLAAGLTNANGNALSDKTATNTIVTQLASGTIPAWLLWVSGGSVTGAVATATTATYVTGNGLPLTNGVATPNAVAAPVHYITNGLYVLPQVWSGPTNYLAVSNSLQTYSTTNDMQITNYSVVNAALPAQVTLWITNGAATNCLLRFPLTANGVNNVLCPPSLTTFATFWIGSSTNAWAETSTNIPWASNLVAGAVIGASDGSSLWNVRISGANIASNNIPVNLAWNIWGDWNHTTNIPLQEFQLSTNYIASAVTNSSGGPVLFSATTAANDGSGLWNVRISGANIASNNVPVNLVWNAHVDGGNVSNAVGVSTTTTQTTFTNLVATNAILSAVSLESYVTNLPTVGNGTVTWDITKPSNHLATNAVVTINLTGLSTTNEQFSQLTLSNSAASGTLLITLGGFCAFTNGAGIPTSTFYITNLSAKRQVCKINVNYDPLGPLTNCIVTHFFDK